MERVLKAAIVFSVACWGFTGFMSNMLDFSHGWGQVKFVITMAGEGALEAPGVEWRRIESPFLISILSVLGFALIYGSKLLTGILCLIGSILMVKARNSDADLFERTKLWGVLGCGVSLIMLFLGFIVITGQYFAYWRVPYLGGVALEYAFYYLLSLTGFILYLKIPDHDLNIKRGAVDELK